MARKIIKEDAAVNEILGKLNEQKEKAEEPAKATTPNKKDAPKGYKVNPLYVEVKTARVQLVLKPSTVEEMKAYCKSKGLSVNQYIEDLILQDQGKRGAKNGRNC